jgi:hypothetical protein
MTTVNDDGLDDVAAITPTLSVKVAGGCAILAGVLALVLALQAAAVLQVAGVYRLAILLLSTGGLGAIVGGFRLTRMLGGSAHLTAGFSGAVLLTALVWFVLALSKGVLVLLALPILPIAGTAVVTSVANRVVVQRADAARSRLRAQGLDAGL